jgi:AraC family transcriptional regulator of adaptative response/methylated-DNA-[protein]-cysteine methyltransferase
VLDPGNKCRDDNAKPRIEDLEFNRKDRSARPARRPYVWRMENARIDPMPRTTSKPAATDERRWAAVLKRDRAADGTFVLGVATTGIYCKPSCPARKPLRKNVTFYATCADAEAVGFRACKRCKPNIANGTDAQAEKIAAACRTIASAETAPSLEAIASVAGLSPYHFHRVFKAATGLTPKAYAVAHRSRRMREALKGANSVTEAIYEAGFNSTGRFYADAAPSLGMKPAAYRAGGADAEIRFSIAKCTLGKMLVAATDKGVCALFFGDGPAQLEAELRDRFPRAKLTKGDRPFAKLLARIVAYVEAPGKNIDLPLDVQGTAFQHRVWTALRDIPPGETVTYGEIARRIGKPDAVRAVGAACGANRVAVVIPCHRVVGSSGNLTGYRWGTERKQALLDREKRKR